MPEFRHGMQPSIEDDLSDNDNELFEDEDEDELDIKFPPVALQTIESLKKLLKNTSKADITCMCSPSDSWPIQTQNARKTRQVTVSHLSRVRTARHVPTRRSKRCQKNNNQISKLLRLL